MDSKITRIIAQTLLFQVVWIATLGNPTCTPSSRLSTLEYALKGYSVMHGYPLANGVDPGFRFKIFEEDYSNQNYSPDCRFQVPSGIDITVAQSCVLAFNAREVRSQQQFQDALQVNSDIMAEGWGARFEANAAYQSASSTLSSSGSVYIISNAECQYYSVDVHSYNPPPLGSEFVAAVRALPTSGGEDDYMRFFDDFGTHFVKSMVLGARITYRYTMTESEYSTVEATGYSISALASYSGLKSVSLEGSLTSSQKRALGVFEKNVNIVKAFVGGLPSASTSEEWLAEITNPLPTKFTLSSIEDLFTSEYFGDANGIDYSAIKNQIITFKGKYHEYLESQGRVIRYNPTTAPSDFKVIAYTANEDNAGSDSGIYISLIGELGKCDEYQLNNADHDDFQVGARDEFVVPCRRAIGELLFVELRNGGTGGLKLDRLSIEGMSTDRHYNLPCNCWLDDGTDRVLQRKLVVTEFSNLWQQHSKYRVNVKVGDHTSTTGTDSPIFITLYSATKSCGRFHLDTEDNDFEHDSHNTFYVACDNDMGPLEKIYMENEGTDGLYVKYVSVKNMENNDYDYISCNKWLDDKAGGGLQARYFYN